MTFSPFLVTQKWKQKFTAKYNHNCIYNPTLIFVHYSMQKDSNTKYPLVSIIIVTWNSEKDIEDCLDSVVNIDYPNFNIIVVDNASSDNTVSLVKKYKNVQLLAEAENNYFTGGNNIGIQYALDNYNPEMVMILNPDTKVETNLLKVLSEVLLRDKKIGAVGPKIKFWNNENEGKINSAGLDYDGFMRAYDWGVYEEDKGQFDQERIVFGVTGTCILMKSEMLREIGLLWEKLEMYLDELELFIRAKDAGWKAIYTPGTTVYHKYQQSTNQNKMLKVEAKKMRNWLYIAFKHYSFKGKLLMILKYIKFQLLNK